MSSLARHGVKRKTIAYHVVIMQRVRVFAYHEVEGTVAY